MCICRCVCKSYLWQKNKWINYWLRDPQTFGTYFPEIRCLYDKQTRIRSIITAIMVRNWWIGTKDAPCVPTHLRLFSSGFLNQRHIYLWKELFWFFWKLLIQILKFGWCITNIDINLVYNLTNILVEYAGRHVSVTFLIKILLQKLLYIPYIKSFVLEKWCLLLSDTKCYCYPIHKTYFLASNPKYNYIFKHNLSLKKTP